MRKVTHRGFISCLCLLLCAVFVAAANAQANTTDSGRRKLSGSAPSDQIHIDQDCRIFGVVPHTGGTKVRAYRNSGICDVTDVKASSRDETYIKDGKKKLSVVSIQEHTFGLHNPTDRPVTFVLDHALPKGWQIDSDPQPNRIEGKTATFLVPAPPGATVSLHVGWRNPPKPPL